MKALALLLLSGIIAAGCASSRETGSDKKSYENLIELRPPDRQNPQDSKIYVDSVKRISCNNRQALLISGRFSNGCTHLGQASYTMHNGKPALSLSAWRDPDMMCTQALRPFSFIFDEIRKGDLQYQSSVLVNGTTYKLK